MIWSIAPAHLLVRSQLKFPLHFCQYAIVPISRLGRILFFWIGITACYGQNQDLLFHHLRVEDGLSQTWNWFTFKDSRGFVWISSLAGLNRFDGTHVKQYIPDKTDPSSILGENIQSEFYEDQDSNLWFSTVEAINKYNWDQDCFDHYQLTDTSGNTKVGYYIFYLDAFQNIWFLQNAQFLYTFHIPTGQFTLLGNISENTIRCKVVTTTSGEVMKILLRGMGWPSIKVVDIRHMHISGEEYDLPGTQVKNINAIDGSIIDGDTVMWILTPSNLVRYSWVTGEEKLAPIADGNDIVRLNDSTLLIGTANEGLLAFNTTRWKTISQQLKKPDQPAGLQDNTIRSLTKDKDNTLWISSNGFGVSYCNLDKKKFNTTLLEHQHQKKTGIIPLEIFQEGQESLLCFTQEDGVWKIDLSANQYQASPFEVINTKVHDKLLTVTKDHNGHYWICSWSGIFVYYPQQNKVVPVTDSKIVGTSAQAIADGSVLLTSENKGLYKGYAKEDGEVNFSLIASRKDDGYPIMLDHKGRIWLNESYQRFVILDSSTFKPIANVPVNGMGATMVCAPDGNTIWVSAASGLYEIDDANLNVIKIYTENTGLPAKAISSMIMDHHGKLWLAHSNGIISFDPKTGNARVYTKEDGLTSLEYTSASCKLDNGEFWYGSTGELTHFFPDSIDNIQVKAFPQITELLVNDRPPEKELICEKTGATNITEIKKLTFDFKHNTITFLVNALEYSAPALNKVVYSMEGLDDGLITVANGSRVRFPNMAPGSYRFKVYAFNSDGVQNPDPHTMDIDIKPPYYKTWWFVSLMALLSIGIIAYIIYLRFSKALELQKVRLKLYENLHDDVGSRLTAIVLSAEDLERNENIHHPKLHAISQIARSIVGNMRRLVWAIDPENDSMNSLLQKITHDKSTILDDTIHFNIEMDPGIKNNIVPGEVRYQISSICNEAFTNITKYAQAKNVFVRITKESGSLKLLIRDDGIGFAPDEKTKNALTGSGYGLANMQRRASRVGGTFALNSILGQGTTIEAKFPLS